MTPRYYLTISLGQNSTLPGNSHVETNTFTDLNDASGIIEIKKQSCLFAFWSFIWHTDINGLRVLSVHSETTLNPEIIG